MTFKILNTKIHISFIFAALICFMLATDRTGYLIPCMIAIILHELGHLFAMWLFECTPREIKLIPTSIEIIRGFSVKSYGETIISLMGPIVNLFLSLIFYINYLLYEKNSFIVFSLLNLIIGLFNLLPVKGLDGGTILFNIAAQKRNLETAARLLSIITLIFGFIILTFAFFLLFNGSFNPSIFIIAIYLLITALIKYS